MLIINKYIMLSIKDSEIQHTYSILMLRHMTYWTFFCSCLTGQRFHHHCLPWALSATWCSFVRQSQSWCLQQKTLVRISERLIIGSQSQQGERYGGSLACTECFLGTLSVSISREVKFTIADAPFPNGNLPLLFRPRYCPLINKQY